jgi:hypothetical protein
MIIFFAQLFACMGCGIWAQLKDPNCVSIGDAIGTGGGMGIALFFFVLFIDVIFLILIDPKGELLQ